MQHRSDVPHPPGRAQGWTTADPDLRSYLEQTVALFVRELGANLVGVVLHGSLAAGCYYRAKSDLDLLVVAEDSLSPRTRERIGLQLARRATGRPTLGDLELSLIRTADAQHVQHPCPHELHYSDSWRDRILAGEVDFAAEQRDPDLAAHAAVARARGVALYGGPPQDLFGPVPASAYIDAIIGDVAWTLDGDHLLETPFYGVLNACRTLQLAELGVEHAMEHAYSKEEGALWALQHIASEHCPVVEQALACYRSSRTVTAAERTTDGHAWDVRALAEFRTYTRNRLVAKGGDWRSLRARS